MGLFMGDIRKAVGYSPMTLFGFAYILPYPATDTGILYVKSIRDSKQ